MALELNTLRDNSIQRVITAHVLTGDETDGILYDFSADSNTSGDAGSGIIIEAWAWGYNNIDVDIEWKDATTDVTALHIPRNTTYHFDFRSFGGIPNFCASPTGDLTITTSGVAGNGHIQVILNIGKLYNHKLMHPMVEF